MPTDLPQGKLFVSRCECDGATLLVRFTPDYPPVADSATPVLRLRADGAVAAPDAAQFMSARREAHEAVYLGWSGTQVYVESESGACLDLRAESFSAERLPYDADDLHAVLGRVHGSYLSERRALADTVARIHEAHDLAIEQARRVGIKASQHPAGSTAATLYAQQLSFITRVLEQLGEEAFAQGAGQR